MGKVLQDDALVLHGVALSVFDTQLILTGKSAIGKSEIALELVSRGHSLITDDIVNIQKINNQLIIKSGPHSFTHIRGVGFIDLAKLYNNIQPHQGRLDLIIELTTAALPEDRLCQLKTSVVYLGLSVTKFDLPIGQKRPVALLVELIVKYYNELLTGYDSNQDFIDNQLDLLKDQ